MSSQSDHPINIELTIAPSQPEFLEGLEAWLRLGLLSEAQVRQLSENYLSCPLPEVVLVGTEATPPTDFADFVPDFVAEETPPETIQPPKKEKVGVLQSLMAELSVRWLLFLGVFLVVVSSGVLAASQWEKFPAAAQYGVLLAYTLIFWGVSFWAGKQPNLGLTAQTLQIVSLLLVPVNFWGMDSFGLWNSPLELGTIAIASIALTSITFLLFKNPFGQVQWLSLFNILALSYLHWGWKLPAFPLTAVYIGMVGTSIFTFYQTLRNPLGTNPRLRPDPDDPDPVEAYPPVRSDSGISVTASRLIVVYALVVLLVRAIFVVQIPLAQLGLAIGLCGWILAWLQQQRTESQPSLLPWDLIGGGLLLVGWLVSFQTTVPWQATGVSLLSFWFLFNRIQRFWRLLDLGLFFAVGLQTVWLGWRLIPQPTQQWAIATLTQLTASQSFPWALLGIALFPYVIFMVGITDWLQRISKPKLARFSEILTFGLGIILTVITLGNPTLRTFNLILSTLTLAIVTQRRSARIILVYLTHTIGLLAVGSTIDYLLPNLSNSAWATIILAVMVAEWAFSIIAESSVWGRSAWHLGLVLAGLSYALLLQKVFLSNFLDRWGSIWLITPIALTGLASQSDRQRKELASWLSVLALLMAQPLTIYSIETRLLGLSLATALMFVNTRYLRQTPAAAINVGFALSFIGVFLWDVFGLTGKTWFLVIAIAAASLWIIRGQLLKQEGTLAAVYAEANDKWAIALAGFNLLNLGFHALFVYLKYDQPNFVYLIAAAIHTSSVLYRSWGIRTIWTIIGFRGGLQLCIFEIVHILGGSLLDVALVNTSIGFITLVIGDWWRRKRLRVDPDAASKWGPNSFLGRLPLVNTVIGTLFRSTFFTNWTGLLSLVAGITVLGVSRRRLEWNKLAYIGLAALTEGIYELVIYQLLQAKGGNPADGVTVLALVATAIALIYNLAASPISRFLNLTKENIKTVAHIHWGLGSILMVIAALLTFNSLQLGSPRPQLAVISIILSVFLAIYAIAQGRNWGVQSPVVASRLASLIPQPSDSWVYIGIIEIAGVWMYARLIWVELRILDPWIAAICCLIAYVLSILPWRGWGWAVRPWQRSAGILPTITAIATSQVIPPSNLIIIAIFYLWFARRINNVRSTYLSVALVDWAISRWFLDWQLKDLLWYTAPAGLSMLYIAQFDPILKLPSQKQNRHTLRLIGINAICAIAFFFNQETGLLPGFLSIITIFAGLALRIRAFLYIGTATFLLTVLYQSVVLIFNYPFFKWIIGLILGIGLISLAANFETRREQITSLVRYWLAELAEWE